MRAIALVEEEKLLGTSLHEKTTHEDQSRDDEQATWQNLPHKKQLFLIALCRLSTPLSNACLLPYLFFLVKSIISEPEHPTAPQQISRLTGLLVAAFPIGQMLTSMLWGRLSDVYGRKPAILLGLAISIVANVGFGFSRTIGMLVCWRIVAGMANGIVGVLRTMTAEIVQDRKHRPRAFLAPPVVFNSGRVIALAVGGCLADPVKNLPRLFGPSGLFNVYNHPEGVEWTLDYPYALPALFNGVVLSTCLVVAALWLRESHPTTPGFWHTSIIERFDRLFSRLRSRRYELVQSEDTPSANHTVSVAPQTSISTTATPKVPFRDIWTRDLCKKLCAFALLPLHNTTFLHIFPLLLSMPAILEQRPTLLSFKGGLGLSSPIVGLLLASFGIAGIILQLLVYPRIHASIGTLGVFRLANTIFPFAYMFAPYLSLLAGHDLLKWITLVAILFMQVMARTMAIPSSVLLLTDAAPSRSVLGTVHGTGNTVAAFASACGPAIGGVLLAKGIEFRSLFEQPLMLKTPVFDQSAGFQTFPASWE
ncbi:major facilitator superfamily domain-containing protein [Paraphoma chrysanthemicola]|uniref:Major facilitator superfamily domain-containing protein n=1 Tax=Paraphoma chrysanthemicola TaxID=798071 RepID=A0A8K0RIX0_9PLEO|nr:major facilitator superfamily domain-containing protein [Paraphoma chrysanthemicola]